MGANWVNVRVWMKEEGLKKLIAKKSQKIDL